LIEPLLASFQVEVRLAPATSPSSGSDRAPTTWRPLRLVHVHRADDERAGGEFDDKWSDAEVEHQRSVRSVRARGEHELLGRAVEDAEYLVRHDTICSLPRTIAAFRYSSTRKTTAGHGIS
jgi:hypothetical protein